MATSFKIVGRIPTPKEDNFCEVKNSTNGRTHLLHFNVRSGSNTFRMNLMGYLANDESARTVYAFKKENGKNVKCNFPYAEREKHIKELSEFSKMIIVDGDDRFECCHNVDYITELHNKINAGYFENRLVRVDGEIEYSKYRNKEGIEVQGKKYIPKRIYLLSKETEEIAEANMELYIDENSILAGENEATMVLAGKIAQYNSKVKKDTLFEEKVEFNFEENGVKALEIMKDRLNLDKKDIGKLNKLGVKVDLIRGSEDIELTRDMLSDEENDLIDLGLMSIEELKKEKGMGKGAFREKNIFKGLSKGYSSGAMLTDSSLSDFEEKMELDTNDVFGVGSVETISEDDIPF